MMTLVVTFTFPFVLIGIACFALHFVHPFWP